MHCSSNHWKMRCLKSASFINCWSREISSSCWETWKSCWSISCEGSSQSGERTLDCWNQRGPHWDKKCYSRACRSLSHSGKNSRTNPISWKSDRSWSTSPIDPQNGRNYSCWSNQRKATLYLKVSGNNWIGAYLLQTAWSFCSRLYSWSIKNSPCQKRGS